MFEARGEGMKWDKKSKSEPEASPEVVREINRLVSHSTETSRSALSSDLVTNAVRENQAFASRSILRRPFQTEFRDQCHTWLSQHRYAFLDYLDGAASAFNPFPLAKTQILSDEEALSSDWQAVMQDFSNTWLIFTESFESPHDRRG